MTTPIRPLSIAERWDCHGCSTCCRVITIPLNSDDLQKIRDQNWDKHKEFRGTKTVARASLMGGRVLARRRDGSCVFLNDEGRCRIHEIHGEDAKPAVCRLFPLHLVPLGKTTYLTTRRSCPSAAADRGRPLKDHIGSLQRSGLAERFTTRRPSPPLIARRAKRSWRDFLATADALARLTTDPQFPLVRRLVHGLRFCELLDQCKLKRIEQGAWSELMELLESSAPDDAGEFFRDRQPPSAGAAALLRQLAVHYIRSHPGFVTVDSRRARWQLMWMSTKFARGKGGVPPILPGFSSASFSDLERPLGPLPEDISHPLERYYASHVTSKLYALSASKRSLVDSYRGLALTYPIVLWLLRLAVGQRTPTTRDIIDLVVAIERGYGLKGTAHGAKAMARSGQLERLVAWYAR